MRPEALPSKTIMIKTGCGKLYCTITKHEGKIKEIFLRLGKAGNCQFAMLNTIARLICYSLSVGGKLEWIIEKLSNTQCPNPVYYKGDNIMSCTDAIMKILKKEVKYEK